MFYTIIGIGFFICLVLLTIGAHQQAELNQKFYDRISELENQDIKIYGHIVAHSEDLIHVIELNTRLAASVTDHLKLDAEKAVLAGTCDPLRARQCKHGSPAPAEAPEPFRGATAGGAGEGE